jgi:hypothetical protein
MLRTAWWPRFAVAGLVLTAVGVTLLSGTAQGLVTFGGAVVFLFAAMAGVAGKSWDQDRRANPSATRQRVELRLTAAGRSPR